MKTQTLLSALISLSQVASAVRTFHKGDPVQISVKALTPGGGSVDDKLYLYPVDYYNPTLGPCPPRFQNGSTGDIVHKDPFFNNNFKSAPVNTTFLSKDAKCALVCDKYYKEENVTMINDLIKRNYKLNFYVDDLPVGHEQYDFETKKFYVDLGVPLGYLDTDKIPHLFNHFQFAVYYKSTGNKYEILYSTVSTQSLTRIPQVPLACHLTPPLLLRYSDYSYNGNRISYDIVWKEVHVASSWKRTWDIYHNDLISPFVTRSIVTMFIILTVIVAIYTQIILKKAFTLEKNSAAQKAKAKSFNDIGMTEEFAADDLIDDLNELSWPSLVHDVFRRPAFSTIFYFVVALGAQLLLTILYVVVKFSTGSLNIHGVNSELESSVLNSFFMSTPFYSLFHCYLFKFFGYNDLTKGKLLISVFLNCLAVPVILYPFVFYYNSIHASVQSPLHISVHSFQQVSLAYTALAFVSFMIGFKILKPSSRPTSEIIKQIPELPITFRTVPNMIVTGLFPFGAILVPLSSVYISLWYNHFFAGSTWTVSVVLLVVLLACISMLNMYFGLCVGNWKWTWFSFLCGCSVGVYTFLYSFYLTKWNFGDGASFHIFVLQNLAISTVLGLAGGSVAFLSCFVLVTKLYANL